MTAIDNGDVATPVLLDLSAAFDTIDHPTLLNILRDRFGVDGDTLSWIKSYLTDRSQIVDSGSGARPITCGVPQGSVLGPRQFISYIEEMATIFTKHDVTLHGFAYDMRGLVSSSPSCINATTTTLTKILVDVETKSEENRSNLVWICKKPKKVKPS